MCLPSKIHGQTLTISLLAPPDMSFRAGHVRRTRRAGQSHRATSPRRRSPPFTARHLSPPSFHCRRGPRGQRPARPRPALWLGLLFLAAIVLLGWLSAHWLLQAAQGNFIFPAQSLLVILCICGLISIVVCIYSLLQCRLRSCRWLTVYGLALTLILGLVMVLTILTNMSFSSDINLLQRLIWELIYIGEVMWAGCALSLANWF